jgi:lipopolysaccharide transport system ATP-binding protein
MNDMSGDVVICARGLGKRYRIGRREAAYGSLRESLANLALAPVRRLAALSRGEPLRRKPEIICALEDVDLDVRRGEVLGIIGRNGAGKSTLLKILSRITEPTTGRVELVGRVGSLLEVGTGFHPELTGRENIYLNGAILGMRKAEIDRRFDEIVDFAEVERFLDTPVKRYSSGMYVRLAFAVAAHLDTEILLVDEVLAVGDAAFRKKCIGKMDGISKDGRTVCFVSHDLASIRNLCTKVALLVEGRVELCSHPEATLRLYAEGLVSAGNSWERPLPSGGRPSMTALSGVLVRSSRAGQVASGEPLEFLISYQAEETGMQVHFAVGVYSALGEKLVHLTTRDHGSTFRSELAGTVRCRIDRLPLPPGQYVINVSMHSGFERLDHVPAALTFTVDNGDFFHTGRMTTESDGKVLVDHSWGLVGGGCG